MHTTWTRRDPVSPLSQSGEARRCNNAGYGLVGVLEELSDEQIARNFDANFFRALQVIRAALPILLAQRCGHIVNISAAAVVRKKLATAAKDKKTMSFIMPQKAVEKGVPKPVGDSVTLGKVDAARFAAMRFGSDRTAENEKRVIEKLKTWLSAPKIAGKGEPIFAYYDPPWTPVFLRMEMTPGHR